MNMTHSPHYRLFYAPDNASLMVRLTLEMLELPYETRLVDRRKNEQRGAEFLARNPMGLIPVLEIDGVPIAETGAILLALTDRHGGLGADREQALRWLFWLANTLHVTERMIFYPQNYYPDDPAGFRRAAHQRLGRDLDLAAAHLPASFLEGEHIIANYLAPLLRWPALYGNEDCLYRLEKWPNLLGFAKRFELRGYVLRAVMAEGLGTAPFSAPKLPNSPEGSAT